MHLHPGIGIWERYKKAPSFFSMHMGVEASVFEGSGETVDCHHVIVDDWSKLEDAYGTLFVSMPSLLDPSLAPPGKHIVHAFTPDWIDSWQVCPLTYEIVPKKALVWNRIVIDRQMCAVALRAAWRCSATSASLLHALAPGLSVQDYEAKKEEVSAQLIDRLDAVFPGLKQGVVFKEVRYG
eukprot:1157553-Pelagomonas_calceolata.AAC.11